MIVLVRVVGIAQGFFRRLDGESISQLGNIAPNHLLQDLEQGRIRICEDVDGLGIAGPRIDALGDGCLPQSATGVR